MTGWLMMMSVKRVGSSIGRIRGSRAGGAEHRIFDFEVAGRRFARVLPQVGQGLAVNLAGVVGR